MCHFGNYFVSCKDINDPAEVMYLGQLATFFKIKDQWHATTTRELFVWYKGESDASIVGKKLYQVAIEGKHLQNVSTDRKTHRPTGLVFGTVKAVTSAHLVLVRCSEEWINSPEFLTNGRMTGPDATPPVLRRDTTPPPTGYAWAYHYNDVGVYDEHHKGVCPERTLIRRFSPHLFRRYMVPNLSNRQ